MTSSMSYEIYYMFEAYQILSSKEVVFIKGDHEVALPIFRT